MKNSKKHFAARRVFVFLCIGLWILVIVFAFYILRRGGHLLPRASDLLIAEGQVLADDGKPVGQARLTLHKGSENHYVFTDSDGKFVARNPKEESFQVTVDSADYKSSKSTITFAQGARSYFIYTLARE